MTQADSHQLRPATAGDSEALASLFDRCFDRPPDRSADQSAHRADAASILSWRYAGSPHGDALVSVVESEGQLVSSYACGPRVLVTGPGSQCVVGQTGDVMTAPEARGQGLFSRLDKDTMARAKDAGWPVVFGLPNRASAHIFTRDLGWEKVGDLRPWTFVLVNDKGAKEERMRAGRVASAGVPWTAWRGTMARGKLRKRFFGKINVVPLPRFDPDVDGVAEEASKGQSWFVRRTHGDLNWRFMDAPSDRFRAHGVFKPDGDLCGWCVVQLPERGGTVGYIAEVVAVDDVAFAGAMEAGLGHLRKAGASVARAHAIVGSNWQSQLQGAGFRAGSSADTRPIIVRVLDDAHPIAKVARNPSTWFFADADRDAELIGG